MTPDTSNTSSKHIFQLPKTQEEPRAPVLKRPMHTEMTPSVQKTIAFRTPSAEKVNKSRKQGKKGGYKAWLRKALKTKRKSVAEKKEELKQKVLSQAICSKKVDLI